MNLALCHESVIPDRGGCETYVADLARRLLADGHEVHLYASRWDEPALPRGLRYHPLPSPRGPRFLRPWLFSAVCRSALREAKHEVSLGFDKTQGPDAVYALGGLHQASVEHNLLKFRSRTAARLARWCKRLDPANWSFALLERRQYLGPDRPLVIANSQLVRRHFEEYLGLEPADLRVVHCAIDPNRFREDDRPRLRMEGRRHWGIGIDETVGVFVAMNYRLKGLEPLLYAVRRLPTSLPFRLLVAGSPETRPGERLAHKLGIAGRVCFAGHCPEVRAAYFASDFLVHPTFYDPCSLVVLEALACGLPVITSRHNGASELLSPLREGYVIDDPHDYDRLAWCIEQMLDPSRRMACARAARAASVRWTFEQHYQQMLSVLGEAAARRRAA